MKFRILLLIFALLSSISLYAQWQSDEYEIGEILFSDSFDGDLSNWSPEIEVLATSATQIIDSQLDLSTFGPNNGGTTVWFLQKLEGSVMIEYNATALPIGGVADSVSDINSFWMMSDLNNPNDIQADSAARGGSFSNYWKLPGYYVGKGAGRNVRTTFQKHDMSGNGTRISWGLLEDDYYLITPSFPHKIQLVYCDGPDSSLIQYICDDSLYFEKWDTDPCRSGWFAFRGWNTHVRYDNFKVYRLISNTTTIDKSGNCLPNPFKLGNNYPNPFNPTTSIEFLLPKREHVTLEVLNLQGQIVTILESGLLEGGAYTYHWNGSHYPSGVYFSRLKIAEFSQTQTMLMVR
ncbi:T9SS type A sorting domain-containing protein [candidate division KSB1 bacterium]|nr:T9SS type A sorting domain-containing protein [candidate division KSB1 bacterium]